MDLLGQGSPSDCRLRFLQPDKICVGLGSQVLLVLSGMLRCRSIRQPISSSMQHVAQSVLYGTRLPSGSCARGVDAADANMSVDNMHNSVQASLSSSSSAAASSNPLDGTAMTAALADAEGSIMDVYGTTGTQSLSDECVVASVGMGIEGGHQLGILIEFLGRDLLLMIDPQSYA